MNPDDRVTSRKWWLPRSLAMFSRKVANRTLLMATSTDAMRRIHLIIASPFLTWAHTDACHPPSPVSKAKTALNFFRQCRAPPLNQQWRLHLYDRSYKYERWCLFLWTPKIICRGCIRTSRDIRYWASYIPMSRCINALPFRVMRPWSKMRLERRMPVSDLFVEWCDDQ